MRKWEYLFVRTTVNSTIVNRGIHPAEIVRMVSLPELVAEYGIDGWELVSVTRVEAVTELHLEAFTQYTFKRSLPIEVRFSPNPLLLDRDRIMRELDHE